MKIRIKADERQLFLGGTGSGKTVLAKHFLTRLNRVFVIDPKHTFKLDNYKIRKALPVLGKQWRIIYRPQKGEDDSRLADILDELFRIKNVTIYCDELSTLADRFPISTEVLADIARTGREIKVAVWNAIQRPRWVPRVFLTETEGIFTFGLRSQEDRNYIAEFTHPIVKEPIEKYTFWYSHPDEIETALMRFNLSKNFIEKIG